jgi:hypothetical protein
VHAERIYVKKLPKLLSSCSSQRRLFANPRLLYLCPQPQILFESYSFLRSARVRPRIVHLYVSLPVRRTTARTGLFPAFHLFMDSLRSLQFIPSKLNYSLCGSFEVMTKRFVEHFVDRGYATAHISDHPAAANVYRI